MTLLKPTIDDPQPFRLKTVYAFALALPYRNELAFLQNGQVFLDLLRSDVEPVHLL